MDGAERSHFCNHFMPTPFPCHSHGHSGLDLHPGSGSQRSVIRNCRLAGNDIGIFCCWGVRGVFAGEIPITGNRVGISLGHRDTDNTVRSNTIKGSTGTGILLRHENDAAAAGHRNMIGNNALTDNGGDSGVAIKLEAPVRGFVLTGSSKLLTQTPAITHSLRFAVPRLRCIMAP